MTHICLKKLTDDTEMMKMELTRQTGVQKDPQNTTCVHPVGVRLTNIVITKGDNDMKQGLHIRH